MNFATMIVAVFGLFSLIGGVIGFVKAKSKASLIAGMISGVLLLGSAYEMAQNVRAASLVALVVALLLGGRFFGTWRKNHRFMPDLLMIIFSAMTLIVVGLEMAR